MKSPLREITFFGNHVYVKSRVSRIFLKFQDTEVLMLTTNMIRKDLNSQNTHDAGVALSSLACFMSPDLARDLTGDILTLLTSTKPYIRKKAVLILYKVSRGSKLV